LGDLEQKVSKLDSADVVSPKDLCLKTDRVQLEAIETKLGGRATVQRLFWHLETGELLACVLVITM
jgi:hypothetical protein